MRRFLVQPVGHQCFSEFIWILHIFCGGAFGFRHQSVTKGIISSTLNFQIFSNILTEWSSTLYRNIFAIGISPSLFPLVESLMPLSFGEVSPLIHHLTLFENQELRRAESSVQVSQGSEQGIVQIIFLSGLWGSLPNSCDCYQHSVPCVCGQRFMLPY